MCKLSLASSETHVHLHLLVKELRIVPTSEREMHCYPSPLPPLPDWRQPPHWLFSVTVVALGSGSIGEAAGGT